MTTLEDRLRRDLPDLATRLVQAKRAAALRPPPAEELGIDLDLNGRGSGRHRLVALAAAAVLVLVAATALAWVVRSRTGTSEPTGPAGTWRTLPDAPIERRSFPVAAWTGSELVLWAGSNLTRSFAFTDGAAYDPDTGAWRRLPTPGWGHPGLSSAWFDGALYALAKGSGTRFDPVAGTWRDLPPVEGMFLAATVATDDGVFGLGPGSTNDRGQTDVAVARYDDATDRWVYGPPFAGTDATGSLFGEVFANAPAALWTGSEIVVWNGGPDTPGGSMNGGSPPASPAYDPATLSWRVLPALLPPQGSVLRSLATVTDEGLTAVVQVDDGLTRPWRLAVLTPDGWSWRGDPLPLGRDDGPVTLGAAGRWLLVLSPDQVPVAVDSRTGAWSLEDGAPVGRLGGPAAVWTGTELLVWGGDTGSPTTDLRAVEGAAWTPPSA